MFTCRACGHRATHRVTVRVEGVQDEPKPFFRVLAQEYACAGCLPDLLNQLQKSHQFYSNLRMETQLLENNW